MSSKAFSAKVTVRLKNGVLDPQGKAIEGALGSLGFDGVGSVRQGKVFDVELVQCGKCSLPFMTTLVPGVHRLAVVRGCFPLPPKI